MSKIKDTLPESQIDMSDFLKEQNAEPCETCGGEGEVSTDIQAGDQIGHEWWPCPDCIAPAVTPEDPAPTKAA